MSLGRIVTDRFNKELSEIEVKLTNRTNSPGIYPHAFLENGG